MFPIYFSMVDQHVFSCSSLPAFVFFISTCAHRFGVTSHRNSLRHQHTSGSKASLCASDLMTIPRAGHLMQEASSEGCCTSFSAM